MDIDISPEAIQSKVARAERRFWRRRAERTAERHISMGADLEGLRDREIFYLRGCCAVQRIVDEYKNQEAAHQAEVDVFIDTQMDEYEEEDDFQEVVANLPAAAAQVRSTVTDVYNWRVRILIFAQRAAGVRAGRAFRALKHKLRTLLAYTKLRRDLHVTYVQEVSRQAQAGNAITEEQQAVLSAYSSRQEYRIRVDRRFEDIDVRFHNLEGGGMFGFFELLFPELDVVVGA